MEGPNINMHSESQLKELLEIRAQMTTLQTRYDEILRAASTPATAPAVSQAPQPAAPTLAPTPAAPVNATPSPAPTLAPVAAPQAPASAAKSAPAPQEAIVPQAKQEAAAPVKIASSVTVNVRQTLVTILTKAGKSLPFNLIYTKLQATGVELPPTKPMLVVRKLLHDTSLFAVAKGGQFQIKPADDSAAPASASTTAAALAPAPTATPIATPVAVAATPTQPTPVVQAKPAAPLPTPPAPALAQPSLVAPTQKAASSFSSRLDSILNH